MKSSTESKILGWVFGITVVLWIVFIIATQNQGTYEGPLFQFVLKPFLIGMTVIPVVGGLQGLKKAKAWNGSKSIMGRAMIGLSLGLIAWGGGMVIWNYYLFFTEIEVPYPSLADVSFILSWLIFWPLGIYQLSKVIGAKYGFRDVKGKILFPIVLILAIALSYFLQIQIARGGEIDFTVDKYQLFFDLFYPIGDVFLFSLIAVVYMLSRNFLGGKYKLPILLLFIGFVLNYIGDFIFTYVTTIGTYFNGHYVDLIYTLAMFILSIGLARIDPHIEK